MAKSIIMFNFLLSHLPKFQVITELTLYNVGLIFVLAFLSACLEVSFQIYMEKYMILDYYGRFLHWMSKGYFKSLSYILGYCIFCNGFWLSVVIYYLYFGHLSVTTLLFTGLNAVILRISVILKLT